MRVLPNVFNYYHGGVAVVVQGKWRLNGKEISYASFEDILRGVKYRKCVHLFLFCKKDVLWMVPLVTWTVKKCRTEGTDTKLSI